MNNERKFYGIVDEVIERKPKRTIVSVKHPPFKVGFFGVPMKGETETVIEILESIASEERLKVFSSFCVHCGDIDTKGDCDCMRDE